MTNTADIEAALRVTAPADLHAHMPHLAQLIADVATGSLAPADAQACLTADPTLAPLLQALAGKALEIGGATLRFGGATVEGNVETFQQITLTGGTVHGSVIGSQIVVNLPPVPPPRPGSAPPPPVLIIGREDDLRALKARLGNATGRQLPTPVQVLTAVRGWPGVGKTTIAAALAHDPDIASAFPDSVLWTSLGQTPNLLSELAAWGRTLGADDLVRSRTIEEASARLVALLRNRRMLLIVDDVWEPEHAIPFRVGGLGCALLDHHPCQQCCRCPCTDARRDLQAGGADRSEGDRVAASAGAGHCGPTP